MKNSYYSHSKGKNIFAFALVLILASGCQPIGEAATSTNSSRSSSFPQIQTPSPVPAPVSPPTGTKGPIPIESPATTIYYESFESNRMDTGNFSTGGVCFPYSADFSESIARVPGSSIRLELHGEDKNDTECKSTLSKVPPNWEYVSGMKSRAEITHGELDPKVSAAPLGSKLWYQWSVYYPSDEGTFDSWWNRSDRIIVGQISGWGSGDSTVEVEFILGNSGRLDLDQHYTTVDTSVEQKIKVSRIATLAPDTWNDIRVYFNRSHTDSGQVTIWVNDQKVYDRVGPSAIKENEFSRFKTGMYFAYEVRPEVMVSYIDEVRVGKTAADVKIRSTTNAGGTGL